MNSTNKKILIVNSHIPWGGLGQYSIGLAKSLSTLEAFDIYGLVTHSDAGRYRDFEKQTIKTICLANENKLFKYFLTLLHVLRLRPDIILINYNATAHFLLPFFPWIKIVSVIHSDDSDYYRIAAINRSHVDAWIAPSPRTRDGLLEYLGDKKYADNVHLIPHGVSEASNANREINDGIFRIVCIGALYQHKGVDLLPQIFTQFLKHHPNSRLTIVGEGPLNQAIVDDFTRLGVEDKVIFTGVIDPKSVRAWLDDSDVLLFPTRLEGFGLVIIEAMMEGVVPVVTRLSGITDFIVIDSVSGFLVEKDNVEQFVEALSCLYEDRSRLLKISHNSKSMAMRFYSSDVMANKYRSIFEKLQEINYEEK